MLTVLTVLSLLLLVALEIPPAQTCVKRIQGHETRQQTASR
jgi:hypothetical protein